MTVRRPLVVGEVLFDRFPGGQRILGGAPFNVAWNLQGLGLMPLFISAVGADEEGREVREKMEAWGMDTTAVQVTEKWPTGQVRVEVTDGEPHYQILDKQAYDDIHCPDFDELPGGFPLLYLGSLAYRSVTSRSTIRRLMRDLDVPRFVDINIREPWFDPDLAGELLSGAAWVKLNRQELSVLAGTDCQTEGQVAEAVAILRSLDRGQIFFITCGAAGAFAIDKHGELLFAESPTPDPLIDAVGAGDAFASAVIAGIDRGLPLTKILTTAVDYASATCSLQGATTTEPTHYRLPATRHSPHREETIHLPLRTTKEQHL